MFHRRAPDPQTRPGVFTGLEMSGRAHAVDKPDAVVALCGVSLAVLRMNEPFTDRADTCPECVTLSTVPAEP